VFGWLKLRRKREEASPAVSALIRPGDIGMEGRYARLEAQELVNRAGCVWVKTCVEMNSMEVARTPLRVYRRSARGGQFKAKRLSTVARKHMLSGSHLSPHARKAMEASYDLEAIEDPTHPLVAFFQSGWPGGSGSEMIAYLEAYRSLTGNGFLVLDKGKNGYPISGWPMPPQFVRVVPSATSLVSHYMIGRGIDVERRFEVDEVHHVRSFNPLGDPYVGMGDLACVWKEADLSKALTQFALAAMDNAIVPGVVMWQRGAGKDQRAEITSQLTARSGVRNVFRAMVMGGAEKPEVIKWDSPYGQGYQFVPDDSLVRDHIANAFGVPISLLTQDTAALAQAKVADAQWKKIAISTRCMRLEDSFNETLLTHFREALNDDTLLVAFDNPVKADPDELVTRFQAATGGPVMTVNEAREQMQLPPIPGGDVLRQDPSAPAVDPLAGMGMGEDPQAKRLTKRRAACACCTTKRFTDSLWHPEPRIETKDKKDPAVTLTVADLERAMAAYFASVYGAVDEKLQAGLNVVITADTLARANEQLRADAEPIIRETLGNGYGRGYSMLGANPGNAQPWESTTDLAAQTVRTYTARLARSVGTTTAQRVTGALEESIRTNRTMAETREEVRAMLVDQAGPRAETIARTETARAYQEGKITAWRASGRVVGKRVLLSGDPCPICVAAEAQFKNVPLDRPLVPLGAEIPGGGGINDYADINGGNFHPNCRCEVEPIFADEEDES
jgi:phage portal protein BeeE